MYGKLGSKEIMRVLENLIGHTRPVGELKYDAKAFENLQTLMEITSECVTEIYKVSEYHSKKEYSMNRCGREAQAYLSNLAASVVELCSRTML